MHITYISYTYHLQIIHISYAYHMHLERFSLYSLFVDLQSICWFFFSRKARGLLFQKVSLAMRAFDWTPRSELYLEPRHAANIDGWFHGKSMTINGWFFFFGSPILGNLTYFGWLVSYHRFFVWTLYELSRSEIVSTKWYFTRLDRHIFNGSCGTPWQFHGWNHHNFLQLKHL